METKKRLFYIDNIRLLMITLVVVQHLGVTYSGMGSWYYKDGGPMGFVSQTLFGFYLSMTQGYFMGLLFLIAGYFVPGAYDRKGFWRFIGDRLVRLGIPTAIYMFTIYPLTVYAILGSHAPGESFLHWYGWYVSSFSFISGTGPLWFAFALLIFTIIYGLLRVAFGKTRIHAPRLGTGMKGAVILALIIAVLAFLIRTVQPIGTSFMNMMLCYFAQYVVLFCVGILAYRQEWFSRLSYKMGTRFLGWALTIGFGVWGAIMLTGGALKDMTALNGGFTWQSAAFSLWESSTAVMMDIGLLALFREKFNLRGKFVGALSLSAFAVYVFHTPIIVEITLLFRNVQWLPGFKFFAMVIVCLPVCFAAAYLLKKMPLLKKVI